MFSIFETAIRAASGPGCAGKIQLSISSQLGSAAAAPRHYISHAHVEAPLKQAQIWLQTLHMTVAQIMLSGAALGPGVTNQQTP
jgi:hypothetical protein